MGSASACSAKTPGEIGVTIDALPETFSIRTVNSSLATLPPPPPLPSPAEPVELPAPPPPVAPELPLVGPLVSLAASSPQAVSRNAVPASASSDAKRVVRSTMGTLLARPPGLPSAAGVGTVPYAAPAGRFRKNRGRRDP